MPFWGGENSIFSKKERNATQEEVKNVVTACVECGTIARPSPY